MTPGRVRLSTLPVERLAVVRKARYCSLERRPSACVADLCCVEIVALEWWERTQHFNGLQLHIRNANDHVVLCSVCAARTRDVGAQFRASVCECPVQA